MLQEFQSHTKKAVSHLHGKPPYCLERETGFEAVAAKMTKKKKDSIFNVFCQMFRLSKSIY